ncbi:MAG: sugar O-acetyltransferase [Devosia sp.]
MSVEKSGYEKMRAGEPYANPDWDLMAMQAEAGEKLARLNATPMSKMDERKAILKDLLGSVHPDALVLSPLALEYGKHIHLGDVFINFDCIFLDGAEIRIGDFTAVGPRVQFLTAGHPVQAFERTKLDPDTGRFVAAISVNKPITIGEHCWIGAGAIILPGVTIGDRTTIGAGSVVTKSIPADVVAVGSPARVVKQLD